MIYKNSSLDKIIFYDIMGHMLDLYKYHNKPESLKGHSQDIPYKIFWKDYGVGEYKDKSQILNSELYSYEYAFQVLGGRFIEGENAIATHPKYSYMYAKYVLYDRFRKGEAFIATVAYYAYMYARYVLEGRFPDGERVIMNSEYKDEFLKFLKEDDI